MPKWFQRLYYALVDAGGVVSGPLRFRYSELGATSGLQTNDGFGNAPYDPWFRSVFPLIPRSSNQHIGSRVKETKNWGPMDRNTNLIRFNYKFADRQAKAY